MTTTYMGGRRGPPDGPERPLRGLPGGRARPPRPSPPDATPPEDDRPGERDPGDGSGGVVRPLRPLRVVPGGGPPPLRVIPGGAQAPDGAQAPLEPLDGDGHAPGRALATTTSRPLPVPGASRRRASRRRWLAAVLALVLLAGLAVTGRVVADRPRAGTASTAAPTTAGTAGPVRPSPVVATIGTDGFSYGMVAGAGALWVVGSDQVIRVDPGTDRVTARIPVAATGSGPAAVAVGAGAVWVPAAVPSALWRIAPATNKVTGRIPLGSPLRGSISVSAAGDTVWVACCGEARPGYPGSSGGRLLRVDPHRKRVVADLPLPANPAAVAADPAGAWVATADGRVLLVSRKRNRVVATIDAGGPLGFSQTIAVGSSGVWLADPFHEQVVRIDPKTRRVTARIPAGAVTTLAVTGDAVWGLSSMGLVRVDPARDRLAAVAPDPDLRRARFVAADAGAVWTAGWSSVSRIDPHRVGP